MSDSIHEPGANYPRVPGIAPAAEKTSPRTGIILVTLFLGVFALYYLTAPRNVWSGDSLFNAMTARQLATNGSVYLSGQIQHLDPATDLSGSWLKEGRGGLVIMYPPGAALIAAPAFVLIGDSPGVLTVRLIGTSEVTVHAPSLAAATLVSASTTAIAVVAIFLLLRSLGGAPREAVIGALLFACATGAWSVASQRLWAHGPAMMWLTLGLCFRTTGRKWAAGLTDVFAVITRPISAVIGGTRALTGVIRTRTLEPALQNLPWIALGVGILALYNVAILGSDPVLGGYETVSQVRITDPDLGFWIANLTGALLDAERGLLTVSPLILWLLAGVPWAWKSTPLWTRDAAIGGLVYFLLHNLAHDFRGGDGFFGYRYPLEAVAVSVPLLFCSYQFWAKGHRFRMVGLIIAAVFSISLQAFGVANQFG